MMTLSKRRRHPASLFFDPFFHNETMNMNHSARTRILHNIVKLENAFEIEIAAPGRAKDEFKIDIDDKNLSVSYNSNTENTVKYKYQEFGLDSFTKKFSLPQNIDTDSIHANYINGVLRINVPLKKKEVLNIDIH